jgi:DNA end-binding protein Ku
MAPPRASWKGYLKIAEVTCPVALYAAASTSERIALHTINRSTGDRVRRVYVDAETGEPVEAENQVKGYETGKGEYVSVEPEEIAAAVPRGDKTLTAIAFLDLKEVDELYFDRPYYLAPADRSADETFDLIREGMRESKTAAIAQALLFRRARSLLIRVHGKGVVATTLKFDYEVRSAKDAFSNVPATKISGEMLELAEHIIKTKQGVFDPRDFHDRYEGALAELVKAKLEGKTIPKRKPVEQKATINLLQALRESAGAAAEVSPARKKAPSKRRAPAARSGGPRRKAG